MAENEVPQGRVSGAVDHDLQRRHLQFRALYRSESTTDRASSLHRRADADETDSHIPHLYILTEALIGTFCWLGAGLLDPLSPSIQWRCADLIMHWLLIVSAIIDWESVLTPETSFPLAATMDSVISFCFIHALLRLFVYQPHIVDNR